MLSKEASSTIFWVFGMTQPGIEPRFPGPLANSLTVMPISSTNDILVFNNHWEYNINNYGNYNVGGYVVTVIDRQTHNLHYDTIYFLSCLWYDTNLHLNDEVSVLELRGIWHIIIISKLQKHTLYELCFSPFNVDLFLVIESFAFQWYLVSSKNISNVLNCLFSFWNDYLKYSFVGKIDNLWFCIQTDILFIFSKFPDLNSIFLFFSF